LHTLKLSVSHALIKAVALVDRYGFSSYCAETHAVAFLNE